MLGGPVQIAYAVGDVELAAATWAARGIGPFFVLDEIGGMGDYYHAMLSRMGFAENADQVRDLYAAKRRDEAAAAVSNEMVSGSVMRCSAAMTRSVLYAPSGLPV